MPAAAQLQPLAERLGGRAEAEQLLHSSGGCGVLCFAIRRFHLILDHYGYGMGDALVAELWRQLRRGYPGMWKAGFRWSAGSLALLARPAALDALEAALPERLFLEAPALFPAGRFAVAVRRFDAGGLAPGELAAALDRFAALPAADQS